MQTKMATQLWAFLIASGLSTTGLASTLDMVGDDLRWEGFPTADGDMEWDYLLTFDVSADASSIQMQLVSDPYAGAWTMTQFPMFSGNRIFYDDADYEVDLILTVTDPALLSGDTFDAVVTEAEFKWWRPEQNAGGMEVSALVARGDPYPVPEPADWWILVIGTLFLLIAVRSAQRR